MRIVFIGSSHGVPEPNRRTSSILLEVGENRYFIDMGTHSMEQLITRHIPTESVKGIFITHMHGDHTNGLPAFLDLCSWYFKKADPVVFLPEPFEDTVATLRSWIQCNGVTMRPFRFRPVREGLMYQDENIRVSAYRTRHADDSYAYLVEAEGKRIFFSGDLCTNGPQEDFPVSIFEQPVDLAVCEGAHFPATAYLPIFEGVQNLKHLCFTHYVTAHISSILAMADALPGVTVSRAEDGTEIYL